MLRRAPSSELKKGVPMSRPWSVTLAKLSPAEQAAIAARGRELIAEYVRVKTVGKVRPAQ